MDDPDVTRWAPGEPEHPWPTAATAAEEPDADRSAAPVAVEDDSRAPQGGPRAKRRSSAPNRTLVGALLLVLAFGAGVWTQKKNDEGMVRPSTDPIDRLAASVPAEGAPAPTSKSAAPAPKEPAGHAHPDAAALEGVLVSIVGAELVVREASGAERRAVVGDRTTLTTPFGVGRLQPGSTVAVSGPVGPDGRVIASAVVQDAPTVGHAPPDTGQPDDGNHQH